MSVGNANTQSTNQNCFCGSSTADAEGFKFPYPTEEEFLQWWTVHGSKFHPGVGCDMCGISPIIGERYRCKDCEEKSGYDLCGDCNKKKCLYERCSSFLLQNPAPPFTLLINPYNLHLLLFKGG